LCANKWSVLFTDVDNFQWLSLRQPVSWDMVEKCLLYTGCLMKNASTHNFVIYYPISMNKKIKDMVFQGLQNSHKMFFFWRYLQ
jgi:hypothetical protein